MTIITRPAQCGELACFPYRGKHLVGIIDEVNDEYAVIWCGDIGHRVPRFTFVTVRPHGGVSAEAGLLVGKLFDSESDFWESIDNHRR